jgi:hypothetical protein
MDNQPHEELALHWGLRLPNLLGARKLDFCHEKHLVRRADRELPVRSPTPDQLVRLIYRQGSCAGDVPDLEVLRHRLGRETAEDISDPSMVLECRCECDARIFDKRTKGWCHGLHRNSSR